MLLVMQAYAFIQECAVVVEMTNAAVTSVAVGAEWGAAQLTRLTFTVRVNMSFWIV